MSMSVLPISIKNKCGGTNRDFPLQSLWLTDLFSWPLTRNTGLLLEFLLYVPTGEFSDWVYFHVKAGSVKRTKKWETHSCTCRFFRF